MQREILYFHFTWHESPGFDIFFSLSFFLEFFLFRAFRLSSSFRVAWHLRHRLHSYNIGDNLLYHLVAPEARVSFRLAGFEPHGRLTFLASTHSRHSVSSASTPMPCISQDFPYTSPVFNLPSVSPSTQRRQKYPRNVPDDAPLKIEKRVLFLVVSIGSVIGSVNRLLYFFFFTIL